MKDLTELRWTPGKPGSPPYNPRLVFNPLLSVCRITFPVHASQAPAILKYEYKLLHRPKPPRPRPPPAAPSAASADATAASGAASASAFAAAAAAAAASAVAHVPAVPTAPARGAHRAQLPAGQKLTASQRTAWAATPSTRRGDRQRTHGLRAPRAKEQRRAPVTLWKPSPQKEPWTRQMHDNISKQPRVVHVAAASITPATTTPPPGTTASVSRSAAAAVAAALRGRLQAEQQSDHLRAGQPLVKAAAAHARSERARYDESVSESMDDARDGQAWSTTRARASDSILMQPL